MRTYDDEPVRFTGRIEKVVIKPMKTTPRPIREIAHDILLDWKGFGPYRHYLTPLFKYNKITDKDPVLGFDGAAESAVLGFLANCQTWKGNNARRIKKELYQLLNNSK